MVISKIQGGLGNQMFQFAAAFAQDMNVFLDLDNIKQKKVDSDNFTNRAFELDLFPNIQYTELPKFEKKIFFSKNLLFKLIRKLYPVQVRTQQENELVEIPACKMLYLDGYFQSEKYFKNKRQELLQQFEFPELDSINQQLRERILSTTNSVSVHIRRGDYLKTEVQKYHGILPFTYYEESIALLESNYSDLTLVIFSDDVAFTQTIFKEYKNVIVVAGNQDCGWKDMALMSYCKHHIIANSSFSWWGAWLSQQANGMNIAPKNWFNREVVSFDINDIIPESWIKI